MGVLNGIFQPFPPENEFTKLKLHFYSSCRWNGVFIQLIPFTFHIVVSPLSGTDWIVQDNVVKEVLETKKKVVRYAAERTLYQAIDSLCKYLHVQMTKADWARRVS